MDLITHAKSSKSGIITADRYFRSIEQCADGVCPSHLFNSKDADLWGTKLAEAESKLTYCSGEVKDYKEASGKFLMELDLIVTTTKQDRDGDILETKGGRLDPNSPLLWQHMPIQPIGAFIKELSRSDNMLPARFGIADTALGRDAAALVEVGALRVSHGFDPDEDEIEPFEDGKGFHIKGFEIFEVSLVSIPSNTDAVITAFSREKLHHPAVKAWAKEKFDGRVIQVPSGFECRFKLGDSEFEYKAPTKAGVLGLIRESQENGDCNCKSTTTQLALEGEQFEVEKEPEPKEVKGKMECPECGHSGPASAFEMDDDKTAVETVEEPKDTEVEETNEYDFLPEPIRELVCG